MSKFLYFADSATAQYIVPVDRFLGGDDTDADTIVLNFEDMNGSTGDVSQVTIDVASGTAKTVLTAICNAVATQGSKNQVIVVADDVNSLYVDSNITGVTGIAHNVTSAASGLSLGGDVTATAAAIDFDLIDNEASALSFDTTGKAGIIDLVTTNGSEGVTMSGTLGVTGAATFTAGSQNSAVARTATSDGTGTGTIAAGTSFVSVTSAAAANIIILPAPVVGNSIILHVGANGYELRTSDPTSISLNNTTGSGVELAVAANNTIRCICTTSTSWIAEKLSNVGAPAAGGTPDA